MNPSQPTNNRISNELCGRSGGWKRLSMPSCQMCHDRAGPCAQAGWLWVAHATIENNHRVRYVGRSIEKSHVAHVSPIPTSHFENVSPRLHQMVPQSTNCGMYIQ